MKKVLHQELAAGRWNQLTTVEQMANIGSEVERAIQWKEKNNPSRFEKAFERALELLDLSLDSPRNKNHLKEIARTREILVDFLMGDNQFGTSSEFLRKYFLQFTYAARKHYL